MPKSVTFLAAFPPIQSAIKVCGDGGARIQLDIPESEMDEVMRLMALRGQVLQVTIRLHDNDRDRDTSTKMHI